MDTLKERAELDELYRSGAPPWAVWRSYDEPAPTLSDRWLGPVVVT
jgi:hypothetical protein